MYWIAQGNINRNADVAEFVDLVSRREIGPDRFFDSNTKVFVGRAPGRLDVMGGIADYSGSLVLQMPTAEATFRRRGSGYSRIGSSMRRLDN